MQDASLIGKFFAAIGVIATIFACIYGFVFGLDSVGIIDLVPIIPTRTPVPVPATVRFAVQSLRVYNTQDNDADVIPFNPVIDEVSLNYSLRELDENGRVLRNSATTSWSGNLQSGDDLTGSFSVASIELRPNSTLNILLEIVEIDSDPQMLQQRDNLCDSNRGATIISCLFGFAISSTDDVIGTLNLTLSERDLQAYQQASSQTVQYSCCSQELSYDYDLVYRLEYIQGAR